MAAANKKTPPSEQDELYPNADNQLRRKALRRLIGATVLVLIGVLVLPWVFDAKQPELSPNISLHIEGKSEPKNTKNTVVAKANESTPKPAKKTTSELKPKTSDKPASPKKQNNKPPKPKPKEQDKTLDEIIAQHTKQVPTASASVNQFPETGRFIVQIGAYTDAKKIRTIRQKLTRAGLKNYIQNVQVKGKTVTRVRVGPFTERTQLKKAAAKVRALGLNASIYSL